MARKKKKQKRTYGKRAYSKVLRGMKRPKGYGRTTTTGLTKGSGLAKTNPNISLGPTKVTRGTKIRKIIKANKGYSQRRV